jgi:hypothetical protein
MNMHLSRDAAGIAAPFLLMANAGFAVCRASGCSWGARTAAVALCLLVLLIPVDGLPIFGYYRGVVGEGSITLLLLLICMIISRLTAIRIIRPRDISAVACMLAVAGLLLYPSAMGLVPIGVYRLGYRPTGLLIVLMALALWAWKSRRTAAALIVVLAVAAYDLHLLESDNLWDYLTDPLATLWAWGWALFMLCAGIWRRRHRAKRMADA